VIVEQFERIAKLRVEVAVEEISAPLGWRTRCAAVTTKSGALGFYQARSKTIIPVDDCRILVPELKFSELSAHGAKGDQRLEICFSNTGERTIATSNTRDDSSPKTTEGPEVAHYEIAGRVLEVSQKSFWQSHKDAPRVLTSAVRELAKLASGDRVLDLYGGVGLFTAALVQDIGVEGAIDIVEGSKSATADARRNFADCSNVKVHTGDVAKILPRFSEADVIILDPPREGAGREVIAQMVALTPQRIVYVACDPAALARDTSYLRESGYELHTLRAFDLFPMTHHIECVALFVADKVS
jgi:tRNA/tmRNA/rRNA uracil-C5-methylase (TrmA/RlmC/RlmD family)